MKGYFTYKDDRNQLWINDASNSSLAISLLLNNTYGRLETTNKTIAGAINEIFKKQPQPIPTIPQWKEVGTREKNKWDNWQITYDFQENKHYRVYYSWSVYNPVYTIQEFIITDKKIAGVQIQTFNDSANIVILSVQHAKWITIYTGKGNLKGNVWKLEELQGEDIMPTDTYTKEEINKLLENKQNIIDIKLQTINKTIVESINELSEKIKKLDDKLNNINNRLFDNLEQKNDILNYKEFVNNSINDKYNTFKDRLFYDVAERKRWLHFCDEVVTAGQKTFRYKKQPNIDSIMDIPNVDWLYKTFRKKGE